MLVLEKLRAICQSHPKYPHIKNPKNRVRDFYDIERIYDTVLQNGDTGLFLNECAKHLKPVFTAKEVNLNLIDVVLTDEKFLNSSKGAWKMIHSSVDASIKDFSYYLETVTTLKKEIFKIYTSSADVN